MVSSSGRAGSGGSEVGRERSGQRRPRRSSTVAMSVWSSRWPRASSSTLIVERAPLEWTQLDDELGPAVVARADRRGGDHGARAGRRRHERRLGVDDVGGQQHEAVGRAVGAHGEVRVPAQQHGGGVGRRRAAAARPSSASVSPGSGNVNGLVLNVLVSAIPPVCCTARPPGPSDASGRAVDRPCRARRARLRDDARPDGPAGAPADTVQRAWLIAATDVPVHRAAAARSRRHAVPARHDRGRVDVRHAGGHVPARSSPRRITALTAEAMHDIAHFLRPATSHSCATSSTTRRPATTTASSPSTC